MESPKRNVRYWQDVAQDKKVPRSRLRIRACEESNDATSPSASGRNTPFMGTQLGSPPDQQIAGPGPQPPTHQRTKRNKRNYDTIKWSIEEKKKILYCFTYSRYEKWGRLKSEVFEEKLKEVELPPEKIESTTTKKLQSIVSQIHVYIPSEEIEKINKEALLKAANDFQSIGNDKQLQFGRSQWKREEKWVLLWATEYAREKYTNQREQSKEWQRIFHHHCPNKKDVPRSRLTTQKHNIIVQKIFDDEDISNMKNKVKVMIEKEKCPLTEPLEVPNNTTNMPSQQLMRTPPRGRNLDLENTIPPGTGTGSAPPEPPDSPSSSSSSDSDPEEPDSPERPRREPRGSQTPPRPPNDRQPEIGPEQRELEEELANKIEETRGLSMEDRPRLIKLRENRKFKDLLEKVNQGLTRLIPVGPSLTDINCANYGAAWYIQNKLAPEYVERRGNGTRKKRN